MTSVLPSDLTESALGAALDGFRAVVGDEHVLTSEEQLLGILMPGKQGIWPASMRDGSRAG